MSGPLIMPEGGALGLSDEVLARHEAEASRDTRLVWAAVEITETLREAAELAKVEQPVTPASARSKSRRLGATTRQAMIAAIAVVIDTYGKEDCPKTKTAMARAIVEKASELCAVGKSPLGMDHGNIKDVAEVAFEAVQLLDQRDG